MLNKGIACKQKCLLHLEQLLTERNKEATVFKNNIKYFEETNQ